MFPVQILVVLSTMIIINQAATLDYEIQTSVPTSYEADKEAYEMSNDKGYYNSENGKEAYEMLNNKGYYNSENGKEAYEKLNDNGYNNSENGKEAYEKLNDKGYNNSENGKEVFDDMVNPNETSSPISNNTMVSNKLLSILDEARTKILQRIGDSVKSGLQKMYG